MQLRYSAMSQIIGPISNANMENVSDMKIFRGKSSSPITDELIPLEAVYNITILMGKVFFLIPQNSLQQKCDFADYNCVHRGVMNCNFMHYSFGL